MKEKVGEFCKIPTMGFAKCVICQRLKRNHRKLVVGLQFGGSFNKVVWIDLGELEGNLLLIMVDRATHYCHGGWVGNETPRKIISVLSERWISHFRTLSLKFIFTRNGRKFQNEELCVHRKIWYRNKSQRSDWIIKGGVFKIKEESIPRNITCMDSSNKE